MRVELDFTFTEGIAEVTVKSFVSTKEVPHTPNGCTNTLIFTKWGEDNKFVDCTLVILTFYTRGSKLYYEIEARRPNTIWGERFRADQQGFICSIASGEVEEFNRVTPLTMNNFIDDLAVSIFCEILDAPNVVEVEQVYLDCHSDKYRHREYKGEYSYNRTIAQNSLRLSGNVIEAFLNQFFLYSFDLFKRGTFDMGELQVNLQQNLMRSFRGFTVPLSRETICMVKQLAQVESFDIRMDPIEERSIRPTVWADAPEDTDDGYLDSLRKEVGERILGIDSAGESEDSSAVSISDVSKDAFSSKVFGSTLYGISRDGSLTLPREKTSMDEVKALLDSRIKETMKASMDITDAMAVTREHLFTEKRGKKKGM